MRGPFFKSTAAALLATFAGGALGPGCPVDRVLLLVDVAVGPLIAAAVASTFTAGAATRARSVLVLVAVLDVVPLGLHLRGQSASFRKFGLKLSFFG